MFLILFIYLLCFFIILTSIFVIVSKNPVQAVLFLVLVFLQMAVLFFSLGAEFLGLLLITVYIGAIAILFLFVVMLLNLRVVELYGTLSYHLPIGSSLVLLFVFFFFLSSNSFFSCFSSSYFIWDSFLFYENNLASFGEVFYNYYFDLFFLLTLLLLVAMIGVILIAFTQRIQKEKKEKFNFRESFDNLLWINMHVYKKSRRSPVIEEWFKIMQAKPETFSWKKIIKKPKRSFIQRWYDMVLDMENLEDE